MVRHLLLTLLLSFAAVTQLLAANISAYVNRQDIRVNESFNLVFEADGDVDEEPDFSPLAVYFDVLNQSQSSNVTLINGNLSRKKVWTLVLMAKQAGTYALPEIEFGNDRSRAITIKVNKASTKRSATRDPSIYLEAEIDQPSGYVQSQFIYTVRLLRSVDISNASLTEPELNGNAAIIEKLGEDKRYTTTKNGVRYAVVERRYAIFPQQSGAITISPIEFNGQVVSRRRSFFDITPFNGTTKRIHSDALTIDVKPVPAAFKNKHWLPASELKLLEEWSEHENFVVGEPITRTLSLLASGLTSSQLPELSINNINNIKQYPDQPKLANQQTEQGLIGFREEKVAYIPTRAGKLVLPEINIPWWNTKTGQLQYARIQAREINVLPAAGSKVSERISENEPGSTQAADVITPTETNNVLWITLTFIFATLWLITLFLYSRLKTTRSNRPIDSSKKTIPTRRSHQSLIKKLESACRQSNAELAKDLIISWAQQNWPAANISTLGEVMDLTESDDFLYQLSVLNQHLYANEPSSWSGQALFDTFKYHKGKPEDNDKKSAEILEPLHKLQ